MRKSTTISNQALEPKNLDYDFLYHQAIQYLQELSGDIWTDYNLHDPGITILEYLCYAITDLGYRTNLDITDLLYAEHKVQKTKVEEALFFPSIIFPAAPLTTIDYRKLLIDRIPEISNCWIEKSNQKGGTNVYLEVNNSLQQFNQSTQLLQEAKTVLMEHRNLGEDFLEIHVLKKIKIAIKASLQIRYTAHAEDVLLEALMALASFFSTTIPRKPIEELQDQGLSLEAILEGPLLSKGFIDSNDLKSRKRIVYIDQIRELLLDIEGVIGVREIYFLQEKSATTKKSLTFTKTEQPVFDIDFLNPLLKKNYIPIDIFKNDRKVPVDRRHVKHQFYAAINRDNQKFITVPPSIKKTKSRLQLEDLAHYTSIQKFFPHIYGITQSGVPFRAPTIQKAKAKQLKGYLLLFEHFFSTYLVELSHLRHWFSINEEMPPHQFQLFPFDVPDADILLKTSKNGGDRETVDSKLKQLFLASTQPLQKRNTILDHLLARFNEAFPEKYFDKAEDGTLTKTATLKELVSSKTNFLRNYPNLSQNRGLGFNYTQPAWDNENVSQLKKRIGLLLGIDYKNKHLVATLLNSTRLNVYQGFKAERIQLPLTVRTKTLLLYGMEEKAYHITSASNEYGTPLYKVQLQMPEMPQATSIYTADTFDKCEKAIVNLSQEVATINRDSTGFFMLEHLLLRQKKWGLYLQDGTGEELLVNSQPMGYEALKQLAKEVLVYIEDEKNYKRTPTRITASKVELLNEEGIPVMESPTSYKHHVAEERRCTIPRGIVHSKTTEGCAEQSYRLLIKKKPYGIAKEEAPNDFYDFQVSFLFPKWVSRFFNRTHRAYIEQVILENIPIHLRAHFYWLSTYDMLEFEGFFKKWLAASASKDWKTEKEMAIALTHFLQTKDK